MHHQAQKIDDPVPLHYIIIVCEAMLQKESKLQYGATD